MVEKPPKYRSRLLDGVLKDAMAGFAAVMLVGPRAVGKTTTAERVVAQVDRLDHPDTAALYRADPDAALRRASRPLLIDEWQEVPQILAAVKRWVDHDRTPGQFVLTGSVRADLDLSTWAGTGRVVRLSMHPLTEAEVATSSVSTGRPGLLQCLLDSWLDDVVLPREVPSIDGYVDLALRGSFPELAYWQRTERQRDLWLSSYIDDLITRDIASIGPPKDPVRLRRYLTVLALHLAGQPTDASVLRAADVNAKTAAAYDRALTNLFMLDVVPAWTTNRIKRLTKAGKRYLVDTGIAAQASGVTTRDVIRDPNLVGRYFDAFATVQLRAETSIIFPQPRLHHLRMESGRREIDLVIEVGGGQVFGVEFKAGVAPDIHDAAHLVWLRDEMQDLFVGGVVLHSGSAIYELDDRIAAIPLCAAWA